MAGYRPGEFSQSIIEWERRIHPEDIDSVKYELKRILDGKTETISTEYRFIRKDGGYIWFHLKGRINEWDYSGTPLSLLTIHTDITDRKESQLDLLQREKNFQSFFNTISDIAFIYTPDNRIVYTNQTAVKLLGYSNHEFIGMNMHELYPWNQRGEAEYRIREVINGTQESFILPMVQASGAQLLVETQVYKGFWDGKESIYHISRNISEEIRLLEEMKRITSAVESSGDAVLITNPGGEYLFHNTAMEQIFGYDQKSLKGITIKDLFLDPENGKIVFRELKVKSDLNSELLMKTADGSGFPAHMRANVVISEKEKITALIFTFTDISERVEAERQLKESEERLNLALTAANNGVWDWNSWSKEFFMDAHCYSISGYAPFEFPSTWEKIRTRIHPSDLNTMEKFQKNLQTGTSLEIEKTFRFKRKDGSYMWVQLNGKNIKDPVNPELIRYVGTFSDLTDQKERTKRRTLLNMLQTRLLKSGNLNSKLKDITDMLLPAVDGYFSRIWLLEDKVGCSEDCLFYKSQSFRNYCEANNKCLKLAAFSGISEELDEKIRKINSEVYNITQILTLEESSFLSNDIIKDSSSPLPEWVKEEGIKAFAGFRLTDSHGKPAGLMSVCSKNRISSEVFSYMESLASLTSQVLQNSNTLKKLDLSRKHALELAEAAELARREAVEKNEQLATIRMAVNSSSDGIGISTVSGEFFYINETLTELFGFTISQLAITPQHLLFEKEDTFEKILKYTASGVGWFGQVDMLTRKGRLVPVFLRAVPFKDEEGISLGLVWNFTDISEQKESEKKIKQYTKTIEEDLAEKEQMLMKARRLQKNFIQTDLPLMDEYSIHALFLPCENLAATSSTS